MAKWLNVQASSPVAGPNSGAVINLDSALRVEFAFVPGQPAGAGSIQGATVYMPDGASYLLPAVEADAVFDYVYHKDHNVAGLKK